MNFEDGLEAYIENQKARLERMRGFPQIGVIDSCYLSTKVKGEEDYLVSSSVDSLTLDSRGIHSDRHRCVARRRGPREKFMYGTIDEERPIILQQRHLFAVSQKDIDQCTEQMGVEITPGLLGANVVINALDERPYNLSHLLRGNYLFVADKEAEECPRIPKAVLVVHGQQYGCSVTGAAIAKRYDDPSLKAKFKEVTKQNRGLVLTIEFPVALEDTTECNRGRRIEPAIIQPGDKVFFRYPTGAMI